MPETTEVTPAVAAPAVKSQTRLIRKTVYAWFREIGPEATKVLTKDAFKAKVLSIDPNWAIAASDKKVGTHLSWYRSNFKKLPAEAPAVQAQA